MNDAKYIIIKTAHTKFSKIDNVPIIFPNILNHSEMAEKFGGKENIVSAGFISIYPSYNDQGEVEEITYVPYGESISLGIKSREEDKKLIKYLFESLF
jgi:hypothetical protein